MVDWNLDSPSSYSVDRFYTAAGRDSGPPISTRFGAGIEHRMRALVESKQYSQLRTLSDFIRDAAVHRLAHLDHSSTDTDTVLRQMYLLQEQIDWENRMRVFNETVHRLGQVLSTLLSEGHTERATELAHRAIGDADGISDAYWRQHYLRSLEEVLDRYPAARPS